MYLPRISLLVLFFGIASLAPTVSLWSRWWTAYYGVLVVCWIVLWYAATRRVAQEKRQANLKFARLLHEEREATAGADADRVEPLNPSAPVWRRGRFIQCQAPRRRAPGKGGFSRASAQPHRRELMEGDLW
jgi:hypothetical protein